MKNYLDRQVGRYSVGINNKLTVVKANKEKKVKS